MGVDDMISDMYNTAAKPGTKVETPKATEDKKMTELAKAVEWEAGSLADLAMKGREAIMAAITMGHSSYVLAFTWKEGATPVGRYSVLKTKNAKMTIKGLYLSELRGAKFDKLRLISGEVGDTANWCYTNWMLKGRGAAEKSNERSSLTAVRVAFSAILCIIREQIGPQEFNGTKFGGALEPMYQWMGSLPAIYVAGELENGQTDKVMAQKIIQYELFQDWFIGVRRRAAAERNPRSDKDKATALTAYKAQVKKNRSYYHLQLSSFSATCRKAWNERKWADPVQGAKLTEAELAVLNSIIKTMNDKTDALGEMP